jgi:hypothetical protein
MINNDYYGDGIKWFIGVVKDTSDPNNRVRVRIKGIHPEDPDGDGTHTPSSGGGGSSGGGNGGGTKDTGGSPSTTPSSSDTTGQGTLPALPDLPKSGHASGAPISKHFKLGHMTVWATVSGGYMKNFLGQITEDNIKHMSLVATNILDPLKEHFPNITITAGWRPPSHDPSGYHRTGYAVDVQIYSASGRGCDPIFEYVKNNLKGRYSFVYHERNHVHIMFEGGDGGGTRAKPTIKKK